MMSASEHPRCGSQLKMEHELWCAWIRGIGYDARDNLVKDVLNEVAFEVETEWSAATFSAVHGYYRLASSALRTALERLAVACCYQNNNSAPEFQDWLTGKRVLSFTGLCSALAAEPCRAVNQHLASKGLGPFVEKPNRNDARSGGWQYDLYRRLCNPSHSRPGYSHVDTWDGSNGPIYSPSSYDVFHAQYLEVSALCWLLAKTARPNLYIPDLARNLLIDASLPWGKVVSEVATFLEV